MRRSGASARNAPLITAALVPVAPDVYMWLPCAEQASTACKQTHFSHDGYTYAMTVQLFFGGCQGVHTHCRLHFRVNCQDVHTQLAGRGAVCPAGVSWLGECCTSYSAKWVHRSAVQPLIPQAAA